MSDAYVPLGATEAVAPSETLQIVTSHEVQVDEESAEAVTTLGTDEFKVKLLEALNAGKKCWRTVQTLGKVLSVDPKELDEWLSKQHDFLRKPGQEDGTVFYAYAARLSREMGTEEKPQGTVKVGKERTIVKEEHRYALAQLHLIYSNLHSVVKTYAFDIHEVEPEVFNLLRVAIDKLEAGLCLFANKTRSDVQKLPSLTK